MSVNVVMPKVGESITSGVIAAWLKNPGDAVAIDEPIVSVETDKATVDVPSPVTGKMGAVRFQAGAEVKIGEILAEIDEGAAAGAAPKEPPKGDPKPQEPLKKDPPSGEPAKKDPPDGEPAKKDPPIKVEDLSPAVRRIVTEQGLDPNAIKGTGPHGRILMDDVVDVLNERKAAVASAPAAAKPTPPPTPKAPAGARAETIVAMSPIRKRIAERLVEAQSNAAILTTFNEVDMTRIMELRAEFQDQFVKKHGIKLGFMSFFVKAAVEALRAYPLVNAEVRGTDIVYKNYYDVGVAVGGGKGLIVPVIRNAEALSFAEVEKTIGDYGARAKENKVKLEELQGGTFTISNGGIYGSMLSTPILNPPQSGILGMHNIQKRAVVVNDQIVIRPMMYLALSYDHRIVDGREAVSFLIRVKECIEKPERLLLEA